MMTALVMINQSSTRRRDTDVALGLLENLQKKNHELEETRS